MKVISSASGTVLVRAAADEVCPPNGLLQRDIVEFVAGSYGFSVKPIIPPGATPEMFPVLNFQSGKLTTGGVSYPIHHLGMLQNADVVTSTSTDLADVIFDDLRSRLDEGLGYRYGNKPWPRTYLSGVIVQFDRDLEQRIAFFQKVEEILGKEIPRPNMPFKPKTLAFGSGDPLGFVGGTSLEKLETADFVLQRRVGSPYSENRYFSNMPAKTADHIRILELIEAAM